MTEHLKTAILDAKYIDMIALGDFVVRDCGLPDVDSDGNLMPQANEIAAAIFRWAADMRAIEDTARPVAKRDKPGAPGARPVAELVEHDKNGGPTMDAGGPTATGGSENQESA